MLLLVGLPTLPPKLVQSRTYAERMFRLMTLHNLNLEDSRTAILEPLAGEPGPVKAFFDLNNEEIYRLTRGYPYFIQFWCRELYDHIAHNHQAAKQPATELLERIALKLDMDFFEGRWARLTDRQRDLLTVIRPP